MARLDAAIPTSPLVDAGGNIRPEWRAFFTSLWLRTGGAIGQAIDTATLEAQLAAEEAARIQADTSLGNALSQETVARQQADTNETQLRETADYTLYLQLQQESTARQSGDASAVPKSQLCSLWAACNLSFLPTSDPGHGNPWLNGTTLTVGTPSGAMVGIELESAAADWTLEDGTASWLWS